MLNITGMNGFYYIRNITEMRCKYSRILAVIRHQHEEDPAAKEFVDMISEQYDLEDERFECRRDCDRATGKSYGRHCPENQKVLDEELRKDNEFRSPYMIPVMNYLDYFWDGFFLYRKGGSYPIDNNLLEQYERSFTTKRKCSLHFGSDEGVEMSAVYHSVISTLKLCGKSVWNFFVEYFQCEVLGLDTYKKYLPALSKKINKQHGETTESNFTRRVHTADALNWPQTKNWL